MLAALCVRRMALSRRTHGLSKVLRKHVSSECLVSTGVLGLPLNRSMYYNRKFADEAYIVDELEEDKVATDLEFATPTPGEIRDDALQGAKILRSDLHTLTVHDTDMPDFMKERMQQLLKGHSRKKLQQEYARLSVSMRSLTTSDTRLNKLRQQDAAFRSVGDEIGKSKSGVLDKEEIRAIGPPQYTKREVLAYVAGRLPSSYSVVARVFSEIANRDVEFQPRTVLDFGSGPGTGIWAAQGVWEGRLQAATAVEISPEMTKAAQQLLMGEFEAQEERAPENPRFKLLPEEQERWRQLTMLEDLELVAPKHLLPVSHEQGQDQQDSQVVTEMDNDDTVATANASGAAPPAATATDGESDISIVPQAGDEEEEEPDLIDYLLEAKRKGRVQPEVVSETDPVRSDNPEEDGWEMIGEIPVMDTHSEWDEREARIADFMEKQKNTDLEQAFTPGQHTEEEKEMITAIAGRYLGPTLPDLFPEYNDGYKPGHLKRKEQSRLEKEWKIEQKADDIIAAAKADLPQAIKEDPVLRAIDMDIERLSRQYEEEEKKPINLEEIIHEQGGLEALDQHLARLEGSDPESEIHIEWVRTLAGTHGRRRDVVVAAYALCEIENPHERAKIVADLWDRTDGYLVLIESGTPLGFDMIAQARTQILSEISKASSAAAKEDPGSEVMVSDNLETERGHVFGPCAGDGTCPLKDKGDSWCHFAQRVTRSNTHRSVKRGKKDHEFEKFSYVVFKRGDRMSIADNPAPELDQPQLSFFQFAQLDRHVAALSSRWPRVVRRPLHKTEHVLLDVCNENNKIVRYGYGKRKYKGPVYRHARSVRWGDLWPF